MTWEDILNLTRDTILDDAYNDDYPEDNLWSNDDLIIGANEAETEIAKRMGSLFDDSTSDLAEYAMTDGDREIVLNAKVLWVKDAMFDDAPLTRISRSYMVMRNRRWKSREGIPEAYWIENDRVYLDRKLEADGTLILEVCHLPITPGTVADMASTSPAIPVHTHVHMANWIAYRAYQKHDSETYDSARSVKNLNIFSSEVGPAVSDKDLYDKRNRNPESAYLRRRTT